MPVDGLELLDFARAIKSADEIKAMCDAIRACEEGLRAHAGRASSGHHRAGALGRALCRPMPSSAANGWRRASSPPAQRTNPWYNECGDYAIQPGDLVSFDTDLVGRHGYSVDISRSWLTDGARATDEQRSSMTPRPRAGPSQHRDTRVPASSFREIADAAYRLPEAFVPRMNRAIAHGIGLCNEYPLIVNREYRRAAPTTASWRRAWCCASRATSASPAGADGVKLEEQVLITAGGAVKLSAFPFDTRCR